MKKLLESGYNDIVSSAAQEIADIACNEDDFFNDCYEDIFELVERSVNGEVDSKELFYLDIPEEFHSDVMAILDKASNELKLHERKIAVNNKDKQLFEKVYKGSKTASNYNVTYTKKGSTNGPFEDWDVKSKPNSMGEDKAVIKGTPNTFKFGSDDDGGYGPIPRSGVGRKEYTAKYSKTGDILEERERPAKQRQYKDHEFLKESIAEYNKIKQLREAKIIDEDDIHLLQEDMEGVEGLRPSGREQQEYDDWDEIKGYMEDDWHDYDGSQVSAEEEFGDPDWDGEPWDDEPEIGSLDSGDGWDEYEDDDYDDWDDDIDPYEEFR